LLKNPTFSEFDVAYMKIDGKYDEKALEVFSQNLNRPDGHALTGEYKPTFMTYSSGMIQTSKQSSLGNVVLNTLR
jgi:hypothetical protein